MEEVDYLLAGGLEEGAVVQRPYGIDKIDIELRGGKSMTYTVVPPIHHDGELYALAINLNVSEDQLKILIQNAKMRPIPQHLL